MQKVNRGCHRDCTGCTYQDRAELGRQHGCRLIWAEIFGAESQYNECPINGYFTGEFDKPLLIDS